MTDVYKIVLPDGQEHAWHLGLDALKETYPDAVVRGKLVLDSVGQGTFEPLPVAPPSRERKGADKSVAAPAEKASARDEDAGH